MKIKACSLKLYFVECKLPSAVMLFGALAQVYGGFAKELTCHKTTIMMTHYLNFTS